MSFVIKLTTCTFLYLFITIIYPLHVLNRLTIHQEAVTVYAACGIYHAESILKIKYHVLHIQ
jgi:adenosine/AMP kinase